MKLLCLSNGHGEDTIALRILQELQRTVPRETVPLEVAALPLVGTGQVYIAHGIPLAGPTQSMPSGGFVYMDGRQLMRDMRGGLLGLTRAQLRVVRSWAKEGGVILAVGDIVPLLFAWWSGAPYAFVGTARSEYYLRDERGLLPRRSWFERLESWSGSVYLPWERWLMKHRRCKAVFPRDSLTTRVLKKWQIPAFDLGNPMMDGLEPTGIRFEIDEFTNASVAGESVVGESVASGFTGDVIDAFINESVENESVENESVANQSVDQPDPEESEENPLTFVLLPGSRAPEAYENWQVILQALAALVPVFQWRRLLFLGAIAPGLDLSKFRQAAESFGWWTSSTTASESHSSEFHVSETHIRLNQLRTRLILTQSAFSDCLHQADFAIAMAGTATEQFVGLGKPAITIPGNGPQFTPAFAEAQTRLLGPSVTLIREPAEIIRAVQALLQDPDRLQWIAENGPTRMGNPGAARRIVESLIEKLNLQ